MTPEQVNEERDIAMAQVISAAPAGFKEAALEFTVNYLKVNGPTSGEKLSLACKEHGITPHDDRAFGPIYMRLAREGKIEKIGAVRRERGHGTSGGNIWRYING